MSILVLIWAGLLAIGVLMLIYTAIAMRILDVVHKRVMTFINAVLVYRLAALYQLIDVDPLLGESFNARDILHDDIYRFPLPARFEFYTDREKYDRVMHYYEMFKGIDFDVFKLETEANVNTSRRRVEDAEFRRDEAYNELIAFLASNPSHSN